MSFLEHLEELRWHVIRSLVAIMVFTIGAFAAAPWIFQHVIFAPARVDFPTFRWLCNLGHFFGSGDSLCVKEIPFKITGIVNLDGVGVACIEAANRLQHRETVANLFAFAGTTARRLAHPVKAEIMHAFGFLKAHCEINEADYIPLINLR